jgi:hypothetical protein
MTIIRATTFPGSHQPGPDADACACGRILETTDVAGEQIRYCAQCVTAEFALACQHARAVAAGLVPEDGNIG